MNAIIISNEYPTCWWHAVLYRDIINILYIFHGYFKLTLHLYTHTQVLLSISCYYMSCAPLLHVVRNTDNLTFSAGVQAFQLLAYAESPKENDGYSVGIHAGVASSMVSLCEFVRKMAVSSN